MDLVCTSRSLCCCRLVGRPTRLPFVAKASIVDMPTSSHSGKQARGLGLKPSDHVTSPFRELEIAEIWEGIGRTRVRQHVNPLRREHQQPTGPLDWRDTFTDPSRPLVVDLGCGPGRFLMLLHHRRAALAPTGMHIDTGSQQHDTASNSSSGTHIAAGDEAGQTAQHDGRGAGVALLGGAPVNYLGVEIRKPLVERANEWVARLGCVGELHYVHANATISLASMTQNYPGPLAMMAIQFPDPHFKRRHRKRRIFQPQTVREVAARLAPGGLLFLQSDVEGVAAAMRNIFEKYAGEAFELHPLHAQPGATYFTPQPLASLQQHQQQVQGSGKCEQQQQPQQQQQQQEADEGWQQGVWGMGSVAESEGSGCEDGPDEVPMTKEEEEDDYESMVSMWAAEGGWLKENPLGVPTEREFYVQQQGLPVYRLLLVRK